MDQLEVRVHEEINAYKEKFYGLTLRNWAFVIITLIIDVPGYIYFKNYINENILQMLVIIFSVPMAAFGFLTVQELPMEKFLKYFKRGYLKLYKPLEYKTEKERLVEKEYYDSLSFFKKITYKKGQVSKEELKIFEDKKDIKNQKNENIQEKDISNLSKKEIKKLKAKQKKQQKIAKKQAKEQVKQEKILAKLKAKEEKKNKKNNKTSKKDVTELNVKENTITVTNEEPLNVINEQVLNNNENNSLKENKNNKHGINKTEDKKEIKETKNIIETNKKIESIQKDENNNTSILNEVQEKKIDNNKDKLDVEASTLEEENIAIDNINNVDKSNQKVNEEKQIIDSINVDDFSDEQLADMMRAILKQREKQGGVK